MKALLISMAAAAMILAAPAAFAADNDQPNDKNKTNHVSNHPSGEPKGNAGEPKGNAGEPKGNAGTSGGHQNRGAGGRLGTSTGQTGNPYSTGDTFGTTHHQRHVSGGTTQGNATGGNAPGGNAPGGNAPGGKGPSGNAWTHNGGAHAAATNLRHFHQNMRARHRFRISAYHGPRGYHYRHWTFGMTLPEIFFARDYWISDYSDYDLDDPPDGYVWVRYGPDALLIDEYTGEIVEVEYGVFY